jgi:hypothetical protein
MPRKKKKSGFCTETTPGLKFIPFCKSCILLTINGLGVSATARRIKLILNELSKDPLINEGARCCRKKRPCDQDTPSVFCRRYAYSLMGIGMRTNPPVIFFRTFITVQLTIKTTAHF